MNYDPEERKWTHWRAVKELREQRRREKADAEWSLVGHIVKDLFLALLTALYAPSSGHQAAFALISLFWIFAAVGRVVTWLNQRD